MSNISSFDRLRREEEEKDKKNEYYVGGIESGGSGLNVVAPSGPKDPMQRIVNNAMGDTKDIGSEVTPSSDMRKITLYKNGFTVDDGEFRDAELPENKQFLATLSDGYVPRELQAEAKGGEVRIGLEDKRGENYRAPTPPPYVAYSGEAMTLGDTGAESDGYVIVPGAVTHQPPPLDTSSPTTVLQVKLSNGKKLKLKLNHTHTVLDMVAMIRSSDGEPDTPYVLAAGFPPQNISNVSLTISEAGLVGAAVTQKLL
mmetsp:Transcript_15332/g.23086  ORF Transcript_15332/g.23086 Transcript_15332/m.23086 type:complete len:256 (-) Transcript_15332:151-918(-)|eukprot:CAMPEP_0185017722 /NCGR_PEP_ID=MMETSP1103-20130426/643_1 /TAXON_ID=36769 /ORGANISM="Paraphysomonas bandaiensis, Strain Caron Lab Isolate" /LENGTH=255 /DNA_ID=CAMNT_0027547283 /DNA_START=58 /DNA_END=825 /DNA_ORIENTATION=+